MTESSLLYHPLSNLQIKLAYHKALLKHHPDKASTVADPTFVPSKPSSGTNNDKRSYTIDEITTAYKTLSDPVLRAEYDRSLRLNRAKFAEDTSEVFHTGLETVDLDDMDYDEEDGTWYRGCRCGDERGFSVTENHLESGMDHGEVVIGCVGCSLYLKILFAADDG
ncbi:CSL zinc finger-domain-containing protein [Penicillium verhagenii]|nr:CSL zinc finger-domain-containing protein [Penicillium verhagenii]